MAKICLIAAVGTNLCIGNGGQLPWTIPADLKHFKNLTTGYPIVMGRKTFDSIGKPLPKRQNIVITRQGGYHPDGVVIANSLWGGIRLAEATARLEAKDKLFIIGGGEIYKQTIDFAAELYITHVGMNVRGDAFFPPINTSMFKLAEKSDAMVTEEGLTYTFAKYLRR